jgi:hypothetical protein
MSIDMSITEKGTGKISFTRLCSVEEFNTIWKPAAEELGLEMVSALDALWITAEFKDRFIHELSVLRDWAQCRLASDPSHADMVKTINNVIDAVKGSILEDVEISFG